MAAGRAVRHGRARADATTTPHGAPFLDDSYDISELAGAGRRRRPVQLLHRRRLRSAGWFIDDVVVKAGGEVIYSSDFENEAERPALPGRLRRRRLRSRHVHRRLEPDQGRSAQARPRLLPRAARPVRLRLRRPRPGGPRRHELGSRACFIEYTDEAHGYGNNGTWSRRPSTTSTRSRSPAATASTYENGNCADASFTDGAGDRHFSDFVDADQPGGFINNFADADFAYGDKRWHFDYGCLTLDVTSMSGEDVGPERPADGDLERRRDHLRRRRLRAVLVRPAATSNAGADRGRPGTPDRGRGRRDRHLRRLRLDRRPDRHRADLDYAWDFGDGTTADGQTVHHAYDAAGRVHGDPDRHRRRGRDRHRHGDGHRHGSAGRTSWSRAITTVADTPAPAARTASPRRATRSSSGPRSRTPATSRPPRRRPRSRSTARPCPAARSRPATIPAGGSVQVELLWDTRGREGRPHHRRRPPTPANAVAEADEGNNSATLQVTVRGNKVQNGDFEQSNQAGTAPGGLDRLQHGRRHDRLLGQRRHGRLERGDDHRHAQERRCSGCRRGRATRSP